VTEPVIPNGQLIISNYLREHADVSALVSRVVANPPDENLRGAPWIMFTLLSAPQDEESRHDWLVEFYFQLDIYAGASGGFPAIWAMARAVRRAIVQMPANGVEDAVCSRAKVNGFNPQKDTDMEPARDRFIMTASVWLRPLAGFEVVS
jgi:uncharacterized protein (DUF2126 family)